MPAAVDHTGSTFGLLYVSEFAGRIKRERYYYCTCECGEETLVKSANLTNGNSTTCGAAHHRTGRNNTNFKHGGTSGDTESAEYTAWRNMKLRGDGHIPEWNEFKQFFRDLGWRPGDTYELKRYDIHQPHGPLNTYWRDANDERDNRRERIVADEFCLDMCAISG